jgi:hypothetical protein
MDLDNAGRRARLFLIRDRDSKFPHLFDAILDDAGIQVVLSGVQMPRMNSLIERWNRPAAANSLTAPSSGTSATYSTHSGNMNGSTTPTGPTKASPTPDRYDHCQNRSPIRPRSPVSTSIDTHV